MANWTINDNEPELDEYPLVLFFSSFASSSLYLLLNTTRFSDVLQDISLGAFYTLGPFQIAGSWLKFDKEMCLFFIPLECYEQGAQKADLVHFYYPDFFQITSF